LVIRRKKYNHVLPRRITAITPDSDSGHWGSNPCGAASFVAQRFRATPSEGEGSGFKSQRSCLIVLMVKLDITMPSEGVISGSNPDGYMGSSYNGYYARL
jgi:hypothetical protein